MILIMSCRGCFPLALRVQIAMSPHPPPASDKLRLLVIACMVLTPFQHFKLHFFQLKVVNVPRGLRRKSFAPQRPSDDILFSDGEATAPTTKLNMGIVRSKAGDLFKAQTLERFLTVVAVENYIIIFLDENGHDTPASLDLPHELLNPLELDLLVIP